MSNFACVIFPSWDYYFLTTIRALKFKSASYIPNSEAVDNCLQIRILFSPRESHLGSKLLLRTEFMPSRRRPTENKLNSILAGSLSCQGFFFSLFLLILCSFGFVSFSLFFLSPSSTLYTHMACGFVSLWNSWMCSGTP